MRASSNYSNVLVSDYWVWCRIHAAAGLAYRLAAPITLHCSRESGSRIRRHIAHFKFNELLCFKRLLSIQCEVSGLQIWQMCCSLQYTLHQSAGPRSCRRDVRIATEKKTYLFCRVQGPRSKVFLCSAHLCRSQMGTVRLFRRIAATGLSLVRIRSCWQAWKVKIRSLSVSRYLFFAFCVIQIRVGGRGSKTHSGDWDNFNNFIRICRVVRKKAGARLLIDFVIKFVMPSTDSFLMKK